MSEHVHDEKPRSIRPPTGTLVRFGPHKLLVRPREEFVFYASFIAGEYDPLDLRPGDVVLDAGANVGDFTIQASLSVGSKGTVIAVEPDPYVLPYLEYNLWLNHCQNVRVVAAALGIPGKGTLLRTPDGGTVSTALANGDDGTHVAVRSIQEVLDDLGIETLNVIKMDIEGAECAALAGYRNLSRVRSVAAELHGIINLDSVPPLLAKHFKTWYQTERDVWMRTLQHSIVHPIDFIMAEARLGYVAARGFLSTVSGRGSPVPSVGRSDVRIIYGRNRSL